MELVLSCAPFYYRYFLYRWGQSFLFAFEVVTFVCCNMQMYVYVLLICVCVDAGVPFEVLPQPV